MANRERENQFPATSIGRSSGARLQQTATAHESHPLGLSPTESSNNSTSSGSFANTKYRPYTPRHRVGAPTVTTGTIVHPPSPQHHPTGPGGDATSKLQLTNAKAVAQNVGLDTGSVGWGILEKIVLEGEAWPEVWSALTGGKATVLLPSEQISSHDRLTLEFLKDHIVFCEPGKSAPVVTLSGLRGTLHGTTVAFYSTLHPSSVFFEDLHDPSTRGSSLRKLPPLPLPLGSSVFPSAKVLNTHTTLPLPPKAPIPPKPPLPPRPGARSTQIQISTSASSSAAPHTTSSSRIPNPFASLFGNRPSTPTGPPVAASPPASIRSLEPPPSLTGPDAHTVIEVSAIIVDHKIVRKDVGKYLNKAIRHEIKDSLRVNKDVDVPHWVVERVLEFCEAWFPFVRAPKVMPTSIPRRGQDKDLEKEGEKEKEWIVNPLILEDDMMEDTVDRVQEFYFQLGEGLRVELGKKGRKHEREVSSCSSVMSVDESEKEKEKHVAEDVNEARIRGVMELVERTVSSMFYDRLFMQPITDDASHDEALANRVAALNMLDLTLEHLDIEVGQAGKEVDKVVKACGEKLCELDTTRTPKDKSTILVEAHQIVVDGLSRLPPIKLMSPEESKALREKQQQQQQQTTTANAAPRDSGYRKPPPALDLNGSPPSGVPPPLPQRRSEPAQVPPAAVVENEPKVIISEGSPTINRTANTASTNLANLATAEATTTDLSPLSLTTTSALPSHSPTASPSSPASRLSHDQDEKPPATPTPPPPTTPTPVSSDILLPMIIFSVVKINPPHLVSNLLYIQRFRNRNAHSYTGGSGGGEESFCLINLLAVAEFLENVDLEGLGLGSGTVSATELTPIITRGPATPHTPTPKSSSGTPLLGGIEGIPNSFSFRGKVEQQVDAIAGSANKVITGVVDSSFGILRSLLPNNPNPNPNQQQLEQEVLREGLGGVQKQGFGLLRRDTGFSIASIAASLPISSTRAKAGQVPTGGEEGQQLVAVMSRPGSLKSVKSKSSLKGLVGDSDESEEENDDDDDDEDNDYESGEEDGDEDGSGQDVEEGEEGGEEGGEEEHGVDIPGINVRDASAGASSFGGDTRSIRSFESMLSDSKKRQRAKRVKKLKQKAAKERKKNTSMSESVTKVISGPRKSLSDRLASVSALASGLKGSPPDSRRSSLLQPPIAAPTPMPASTPNLAYTTYTRAASTTSSRAASPSLSRSPSPHPMPPIQAASPVPPPTQLSLGAGNPMVQRLPPPNQRFMQCTVDELRMGEVAELLREYRRLVDGVRASGRFNDWF
ncbi:hypothetical protein P691DRAFT_780012 [Macrolepiota fuliginosa MF-IS2]|uniref:VPS9 domain-containing protein n=1 Tax=Macrolepiota fuliginosa MF-IS2 TaxID=1400762 RepID=A0A9P5WXA1_9AGAR|nr:hypothetical protein P691DRAFT_780012 [Macrolepiota fuliginosa MF-IS2]